MMRKGLYALAVAVLAASAGWLGARIDPPDPSRFRFPVPAAFAQIGTGPIQGVPANLRLDSLILDRANGDITLSRASANVLQLASGDSWAGGTTFLAGSGTGTGKPWLPIARVFTSAGTGANTDKTTLMSYTLPANSLAANGDQVVIDYYFHTAANANNKSYTIDVGGVTLITEGPSAHNGQRIRFRVTITRTGVGTQAVRTEKHFNNSSPEYDFDNTATLDETGTLLIEATGTNGTAAANDIVAQALEVFYSKAP